MKDRILLEEIPSGQEYLDDIIEAMKQCQSINKTNQSYWRAKSNNFNVEPYCVKLFKQRWYLVARSTYNNKVMIYSLDRILTLDILTDEKFKMPDSFNPTEFFREYYGVIVDEEQTVEKVTFKFTSAQANYLRSLPMQYSQQEIERTSEFSIFQIVIKPTNDFLQEILKNGEDIEVLEPLWLRNKMVNKI